MVLLTPNSEQKNGISNCSFEIFSRIISFKLLIKSFWGISIHFQSKIEIKGNQSINNEKGTHSVKISFQIIKRRANEAKFV
ncbi:MAG: hypothetical protein C0598_02860 [Marinilabiliales bacterium]|nr:MAG: hypothetical protein C0598_02860 [Marinilabiliales bacterium]